MIPLANHLWQSTLFAMAVSLLAWALRANSAQTRYRLWLVASLKFLIPFSLLVSFGSHFSISVPHQVAQPVMTSAIRDLGQPFASPAFVPSQPAPTTTAIPIDEILLSLWACGSLLVLSSWLRRWIQIRALVRSAVPLPLETPIPVLSCPSLLEPGVFGILHPVLLLPAGIGQHLTSDHLEAILAHELCHVRRRDNLAAAVHLFIETIYWFHPLVWWIGARLVEEREHACDEEVLRLGNQPQVYAESILKTCQFYLESPLPCVSGVTGSDLKKRIVRIMTAHPIARLNLRKKFLLAAAAMTAVVLPLAIGLINASVSRGQSNKASFEVASIKPSKPGDRQMIRLQPGGRFSGAGINVKFLLEQAYDVKDSQIADAPPWLDSERFDIDAKPEDAVAAAMDKLPPDDRKQKLMEMLQTLLTERFKLELGHETKELPVYVLMVAKNGPKIKASDVQPPDQTAAPNPRRGSLIIGPPGRITANGVELSIFANLLSRVAGRVVVNKTGLKGDYDFTLNWNAEGQFPGSSGGPPREPSVTAPPSDSSGPSLFTAIQEQLGLKLESQKAPMDVLMIKHVERPSEN